MKTTNYALVAIAGLFVSLGVVCAGVYVVGEASSEPEIHLIPRGYHGPVVIIFGQPDGAPPKYKGGARVYEIPQSGVLKTMMKPQSAGWRAPGRIRYYYVGSGGGRVELDEVFGQKLIDDGRSHIYLHGAYGEASKAGKQRTFETYFVVDKSDDLEQWRRSQPDMIWR